MEQVEPLGALLRACARVRLDGAAEERLRQAAGAVDDWTPLAWLAEEHGLAPLVRQHVRHCGVSLPEAVQRQLTALTIRHREASRVQTSALFDIVEALHAAPLPHVILKGAVLAFELYPRPELRPRKDIDLLVAPEHGARAQAILREVGFCDANEPVPRASHHHLPALTREREGCRVSVEIHVDAISRDQPERLTFRAMSGPPRVVMVDGRPIQAFGHVDMLRHLASHLLQPGIHTRLIGVTDLVEYAARYAGEIGWDQMRRAHPRTVITLSLMDYLVPLPESLSALRPPAGVRRPAGAGRGFPLLSTVSFARGQGRRALADLMYPSEWWMHAYYGVPPGRALSPVRWTRHLGRLTYWGLRRMAGA